MKFLDENYAAIALERLMAHTTSRRPMSGMTHEEMQHAVGQNADGAWLRGLNFDGASGRRVFLTTADGRKVTVVSEPDETERYQQLAVGCLLDVLIQPTGAYHAKINDFAVRDPEPSERALIIQPLRVDGEVVYFQVQADGETLQATAANSWVLEKLQEMPGHPLVAVMDESSSEILRVVERDEIEGLAQRALHQAYSSAHVG